jgi:thiamine-phosphate pyrophosphorylase
MQRLPWIDSSRLWLVLDRAAAAPLTLAEVTEHAVAGGVDVVVCRIKDAPPPQVRQLALPVREICRRTKTPFVMSHDVELGLELSADAIHTGAAEGQIEALRAMTGSRMALGYSTHRVAEAGEMLARGADYVFLGPVFPTPAKIKYGDPLGLGVIQGTSALLGPVVYIGGINEATLPQLIAAGGRRVAAISALQSVPDVTAAVRAMRGLLL